MATRRVKSLLYEKWKEDFILKKGYLYIVIATLFFSSMEIALKSVSGQFNSVQMNLTRFLIGGLVLIPFALRTLKKINELLD